MSRQRPNLVRVVAGLAAGVLLGACARGESGIGVQRFALDVAFGPKAPAAGPANFGPSTPAAVPEALPGQVEVELQLPGTTFRPPLGAIEDCPVADETTFPDRAAPPQVEGMPREGLYRWQRDGIQTINAAPGVELPVGGFERRAVRAVERSTPTEFSFETVQAEVDGTIVVTSWQVRTAATQRSVDTIVGPSVRTGDPDRGLALTGIERFAPDGSPVGTPFRPATGILYLPLPVILGETWSSAGIDPGTGEVLSHDGTVVGRQLVDACGEVVDGWRVEGSQTFGGAQNRSRTYDYGVATHLGGILIEEDVEGASADGTLDVVFTIGELSPSPLPRSDR